MLRTAEQLWSVAGPKDPLVQSVVTEVFATPPEDVTSVAEGISPEFLENVWRATGGTNANFGARVARLYSGADIDDRAADIAAELVNVEAPSDETVILALQMFRWAKRYSEGLALIERFKNKLARAEMC